MTFIDNTAGGSTLPMLEARVSLTMPQNFQDMTNFRATESVSGMTIRSCSFYVVDRKNSQLLNHRGPPRPASAMDKLGWNEDSDNRRMIERQANCKTHCHWESSAEIGAKKRQSIAKTESMYSEDHCAAQLEECSEPWLSPVRGKHVSNLKQEQPGGKISASYPFEANQLLLLPIGWKITGLLGEPGS